MPVRHCPSRFPFSARRKPPPRPLVRDGAARRLAIASVGAAEPRLIADAERRALARTVEQSEPIGREGRVGGFALAEPLVAPAPFVARD
jgi:hypothetical protein